ncbi:hypothetical protein [Dankookia sp. P2]|uniref:hypothetical protein n=1 Tax=Dankookia sp. P2 TaxID=3423955 RepID=UPI003D6721E0
MTLAGSLIRGLQLAAGFRADGEGADIDQDGPAMAAQQRDGAPAEPAMAERLAGIALDQHVDRIHGAFLPLGPAEVAAARRRVNPAAIPLLQRSGSLRDPR